LTHQTTLVSTSKNEQLPLKRDQADVSDSEKRQKKLKASIARHLGLDIPDKQNHLKVY